MKKVSFLVIASLLIIFQSKAQKKLSKYYHEIRPHHISLSGGVGLNNLEDNASIGFNGKFEAVYFANYLLGVGMSISNSFFKVDEEVFADNFYKRPSFNYTNISTSLNSFYYGNYTLNAYFSAMPNTKYSLIFSAGMGFQLHKTPAGTISYYEKNSLGTVNEAIIDVENKTYTPFLFHLGTKGNYMFSNKFGITMNIDYHYANNKIYFENNYSDITAGVGIIFMFAEKFN